MQRLRPQEHGVGSHQDPEAAVLATLTASGHTQRFLFGSGRLCVKEYAREPATMECRSHLPDRASSQHGPWDPALVLKNIPSPLGVAILPHCGLLEVTVEMTATFCSWAPPSRTSVTQF